MMCEQFWKAAQKCPGSLNTEGYCLTGTETEGLLCAVTIESREFESAFFSWLSVFKFGWCETCGIVCTNPAITLAEICHCIFGVYCTEAVKPEQLACRQQKCACKDLKRLWRPARKFHIVITIEQSSWLMSSVSQGGLLYLRIHGVM